MTRALEATKRKGDRGADVRPDREILKLARPAFEAGDSEKAEGCGRQFLRRCG